MINTVKNVFLQLFQVDRSAYFFLVYDALTQKYVYLSSRISLATILSIVLHREVFQAFVPRKVFSFRSGIHLSVLLETVGQS